MKNVIKPYNYLIKEWNIQLLQKVGCNVSSLYRELKKRDLLQMPKQVAPCKSVKAPIIPPQTKNQSLNDIKNTICIDRKMNIHMVMYLNWEYSIVTIKSYSAYKSRTLNKRLIKNRFCYKVFK